MINKRGILFQIVAKLLIQLRGGGLVVSYQFYTLCFFFFLDNFIFSTFILSSDYSDYIVSDEDLVPFSFSFLFLS